MEREAAVVLSRNREGGKTKKDLPAALELAKGMKIMVTTNVRIGNSEDRADHGGFRINPHADTGADSDSAIREL